MKLKSRFFMVLCALWMCFAMVLLLSWTGEVGSGIVRSETLPEKISEPDELTQTGLLLTQPTESTPNATKALSIPRTNSTQNVPAALPTQPTKPTPNVTGHQAPREMVCRNFW